MIFSAEDYKLHKLSFSKLLNRNITIHVVYDIHQILLMKFHEQKYAGFYLKKFE